ncbi:MAG: bifunctional enoyl-CoA hydratase/phosphate acetyltransferase [Betaproteobacteria bacterium]
MSNYTNRIWSEIDVGTSERLSHTITAADVEALSLVAGAVESSHLRQQAPGRDASAPGAAAVALVSGLLNRRLPGPGSAITATQMHYTGRVYAGDVISVEVRARAKLADGCSIDFDCLCRNQRGETLVQGTATVLAPTARIEYDAFATPNILLRHSDGLARIFARCEPLEPVLCAVVCPGDRDSLLGAIEAAQRHLIVPILVGPVAKIRTAALAADVDLAPYRIVDAPHSHGAAQQAVAMARAGEVEALMKGSLHTDELMAAVVDGAIGLRTDRRVSHVFVMDVPAYPRLLLITDAAINITPDLDAKADICRNAIALAKVLGVENPKVAILAAVETINSKMPSTLDAAALCKMADRGQLTGGVLDGPLAFDNAVSPTSARAKGIDSPVAGQADILLMPDIEAGNMIAKQLTYLAGAEGAGIVLGARVPIVLTSRSDSVRVRLASAAVMKLLVHDLRARRASSG